jgi:alginate O-acetyltransferase complex protein AlgI
MRHRTLESAVARVPALALSGLWALMAFAIVIAQGAGNAFIYFQF